MKSLIDKVPDEAAYRGEAAPEPGPAKPG